MGKVHAGEELTWGTPRSLALLYFLFGVLWIAFSDWAVTSVFGLSQTTVLAQTMKGMLFVAGSTAFIFGTVRRRDRLLARKERQRRERESEVHSLESDVLETERRLQVILSNITETVLLTEDDGSFTYVCPNVAFIFGHSPSTVREMGTVHELLGERIVPDEFGDGDILENLEIEITDRDGERHTILVSVKSVAIDAGSRLYTIRDITERKRQEERFRAYVEHSSDVITVVDADERFVYVSPSVERVFGRDPATLTGASMVTNVHPDDREAVRRAFEDAKNAELEATVSVEHRIRHVDDTWYWCESRVTRHQHAFEGEYVVTTRDISERRQRESRLSVLDRVLRHNIRNSLNVVLGKADNLKDDIGPGNEDALRAIVDASQDLLEMSEKARRFQATSHTADNRTEPREVCEPVRRVVEAARIEYPEATIDLHLPESAVAVADEAIELAIGELLENAIGHHDSGEASVEISVIARDGTIVIRVADDGPGMSDADRDVILGGEETQMDHSRGLGLWLVRWTAENSGGSLAVEGNEPNGTVVQLSLPRPASSIATQDE